MPPREVLLARLAGGFQAPLVKAAGLFQAFTRNFAYGVKALHRPADRGRRSARPRPTPRPSPKPAPEPEAADAEPEAPAARSRPRRPQPSRRAAEPSPKQK